MNASREIVALRRAADYAVVAKNLRASGLGAVIFGALALLAGFLPPASWPLIALGSVLLAVGIWNRTRVHRYGIVASGACLMLVGLWNLGAGFVAAAHGARPVVIWQILGVWQVIWGFHEIGRYTRFAGIGDAVPQEPLVRQMGNMIDELRRAKTKANPEVVELTAAGWRPRVVRMRLTPEFALCLVNRGDDVRLVEREALRLQAQGPAGGRTRKVSATLGDLSLEGQMPAEHLQRYQAWKAGPTTLLTRTA